MSDSFEDVIKGSNAIYFEKRGIKNPTQPQLGKAFASFYAFEISTYLNNIYEDDVEDGLDCDGKGDLGVDFLLKKEDGSLIIYQSKYKGSRNFLTPDEIAGFFRIPQRILNKEFIKTYGNPNVVFQLKNISADTFIDFVLITNDKISPRNRQEFEDQKQHAELNNPNFSFYLKGYAELKKEYTIVQTASDPIPEAVNIHIEKVIDTLLDKKRSSYLDLSDLIDKDKKYKSIICTIKGTSLKNLWGQYPGSLFNYNIRGYLGENAINKKMKVTIDEEPEKFYFYNNGISAICTELKPNIDSITGDIISINCKDFQIINGAQTTTTIGKYKDDNKLQRVRILLKITKTEDIKSEKKGLNKKIITYNNSQTIIKDSDFRSNDDIQIFLKKKLSDYSYKNTNPYKTLQYLPKRIKTVRRKDCLYVSMEVLARILYVFDNDPTLIYKGTKTLFDTTETGKYWRIFGEDNEESSFFDDKRMNKIIASIFIWVRLEELINEKIQEYRDQKKDNTIDYQTLLAKWHFLWVYSDILRKLYPTQLDTLYKKVVAGKVFENRENDFIRVWFNRIFFKMAEIIEKNYKTEKQTLDTDNIQAFNLKNWLRSNAAFEELKDNFKRLIKEDYPIIMLER